MDYSQSHTYSTSLTLIRNILPKETLILLHLGEQRNIYLVYQTHPLTTGAAKPVIWIMKYSESFLDLMVGITLRAMDVQLLLKQKGTASNQIEYYPNSSACICCGIGHRQLYCDGCHSRGTHRGRAGKLGATGPSPGR